MDPWKGRKLILLLSIVVIAVFAITIWQSWPHLRFWWRFEAIGKNADGFPEFRHRQTGIIMVKLPGGMFWIGAQSKDSGGQNYDPEALEHEGPIHEVNLSSFFIAKFEVSQAEWGKVMGNNPSRSKGDNLPVEKVSWNDCQEFCRKTGLMLPSEAEWEYACRAGTSGSYAGTGNLEDMGWYDGNSGDKTHPVGKKKPNGFGLHDMHGNVLEWCEDVDDEEFYSKPEASGTDPICTSGSGRRVVRGGSWGHTDCCRSAYRFGLYPVDIVSVLGFRPAASCP